MQLQLIYLINCSFWVVGLLDKKKHNLHKRPMLLVYLLCCMEKTKLRETWVKDKDYYSEVKLFVLDKIIYFYLTPASSCRSQTQDARAPQKPAPPAT